MDEELYIECGCCGHWHRNSYAGDCRDDSERFTTSELEERFGQTLFWDRLAVELDDEEQTR